MANNANRLLLIDLALGNKTASVTQVKFGTASCTAALTVTGTAFKHYLYYLTMPVTNTTAVTVCTSAAVTCHAYLASYWNVNQTTPLGAVTNRNDANSVTQHAVTLTTLNNDSRIFTELTGSKATSMTLGFLAPASILATSGQFSNPLNSAAGHVYTNALPLGGGACSYAVTGTFSSANTAELMAVEIVPSCQQGFAKTSFAEPEMERIENTPTTTPTPTPTLTPVRVFSGVVAAPNVSKSGEPIRFRVGLEHPAKVHLTLVNVAGERIYQDEFAGGVGENEYNWDLDNQSGSPVASGLYIYVIQVDDGNGVKTFKGKVAVIL